jgi:hypothetical protein
MNMHVGYEERRPNMGCVAEFPMEISGDACLANGEYLPGQIIATVADICGNQDTATP